jgi:hypothetical protein
MAAAACGLALCVLHSEVNAYEAFFTYPGTRAMSMAGAFVAQADDSSAVWYNPAGLRQPTSVSPRGSAPAWDITGEFGTQPDITEAGAYNADKSDFKFASVGYKSKVAPYAVGVSVFYPYHFALYVPEKVQATDTQVIGRVDTRYTQISVGGAWAWERLSLGISGDYLDSGVTIGTNSSGNSETKTAGGYSLGGLYSLYSGEFLKIKIGATYRKEISMEGTAAAEGGAANPRGVIIEKYLPSRPQSTGIGVNVAFPFGMFSVQGNAGYEEILWSKALPTAAPGFDYAKTMIGAEFGIPIFDHAVSVRVGQSTSTPDDAAQYVTVKSFTYGAGTTLGAFAVDLASEERALSGDANTYNFWSASISCQF